MQGQKRIENVVQGWQLLLPVESIFGHLRSNRLRWQQMKGFERPHAKGIVILVTGWSECFLKYSSIIRTLYEDGFDVHTYDHQSQGIIPYYNISLLLLM